ncbi:hypothetical protein JOF56_003840 [Kibdelosporangium banguiense]|uniref:Uncharacterized protein n=1 Tax=Kibdelosporangium banguiense TaxID=1365924 RepID=A0ABS4TGB9_9PSEU|nr:hypothetical protein [Kibdelosporangium banguiense]MBP2323455.1 hypothetical protein [Kibdelosporangium banguiense]
MPDQDRVPQLSELVWALGTDEPLMLHVVIIPGRTHLDEPLDSAVSLTLCGAQAVPFRALGGFPAHGSLQPGELCDMCVTGLRAIHRALGGSW